MLVPTSFLGITRVFVGNLPQTSFITYYTFMHSINEEQTVGSLPTRQNYITFQSTIGKHCFLKKKNGGNAVRSSTHLLFCLVELDGDVPLEAHIAGIIEHS